MTALAISTPEGSAGGRLPNLLTSVSRTPTPTKSRSLRDRTGRKVPNCSDIELPEEMDVQRVVSHFCVRNTFINTSAQRSPSLEAFYRERDVRTCPSRRVGLLEGLFKEGAGGSPPPTLLECPPDTPCEVKTPTYVHSIRTPCGVDTPLENDWVAQMHSGLASEALPWSVPQEAYQATYLPGAAATGPCAPCSETQYYAEMAPQVHVETVAVSAVGPLAAEVQAQAQAQAAPGPRTVVSLADSLNMPESPHAMLAQNEVSQADSSAKVLPDLLGPRALGSAPPAPPREAAPSTSGSVLEGLGMVYGQACATSASPAEGYVSRCSWAAQPMEGYTPPVEGFAPEMAWATPSQPSSWPTQCQPVYGSALDGGAPLYSAPSHPPTLPAGTSLETWDVGSTAPSVPAPVLNPAVPSMPSPPSRPALGSDELPSMGSQAHANGTCKPCAFLHTKGCENGLSCQFCHLCESGEKKRRRKAKLESQRAMRKAKQVIVSRC